MQRAGYKTPQQIIASVAAADKVPAWIPETIAYAESSDNPNAVSPSKDSYGLYQLNRKSGQGIGYTVTQLLDSTTNAQIGIAPIASAYQAAQKQGLSGYTELEYVADHSGHPDDTGELPASYEERLKTAYDTEVEAHGTSSGTGTSATTGAGNSASTGTVTPTSTSGLSGTLTRIFWGIAGIAMVLLGMYLLVDPSGQLAEAIGGAML